MNVDIEDETESSDEFPEIDVNELIDEIEEMNISSEEMQNI